MARKHIKFSAQLSADQRFALVTILEQTHSGPAFGREEVRPPWSLSPQWSAWTHGFLHNGIRLSSTDCCPEWRGPVSQTSYVLVQVRSINDDFKVPSRAIKIPIRHFQAFKECVEEYNRYFSD